MNTYVLRVWLPDRPGALGQVASRIGSVRGEIVGIDILERGAGRVIDELAVQLPDPALVDLLVAEVGHVDGVDVEEVRELTDDIRDPKLAALTAAVAITSATSVGAVAETTALHAQRLLRTDYAAVVDRSASELLAIAGKPPDLGWLLAFIDGSPPAPGGGAHDAIWAPFGDGLVALAVGRAGLDFRATEREELTLLARVAHTHLRSLVA